MLERPNEAGEFKRTKKRHRSVPMLLNEMRFLSHGPIVRVEGNEARSVVETLSGLLDAIRVLFRGGRLKFAQAVAPYFAGHDASCSGERRVILRQPLRLVPLVP